MVKNLPAKQETGSIPGSGRVPGEGNGNPLQYSYLENLMDRGAWWATVHGFQKSWIWLSACVRVHMCTCMCTHTHTHTHTHWFIWCLIASSLMLQASVSYVGCLSYDLSHLIGTRKVIKLQFVQVSFFLLQQWEWCSFQLSTSSSWHKPSKG